MKGKFKYGEAAALSKKTGIQNQTLRRRKAAGLDGADLVAPVTPLALRRRMPHATNTQHSEVYEREKARADRRRQAAEALARARAEHARELNTPLGGMT